MLDVGHVELAVGQILPGMRIRDGPACLMQLARHHAVARHYHGTSKAGRADEPIEPALQPKPVHDREVGLGQGLRCGRGRLIAVSVGVGADQHGQGDVAPADVADHIAEDRDRGDHP
jgi:hypothetical protein